MKETCVSVHTFCVESYITGQKNFGKVFLFLSDTKAYSKTRFNRADDWYKHISHDSSISADALAHDDVFLVKVCESVISVAHSLRQRATENLMKCIILLWHSSGTITQVSVAAQKSTSRIGCSFVQSVTKFAHASMAFKTSHGYYVVVNWTRSDGKSHSWLPVNWGYLAVSIHWVLNWSVHLFTRC